MRRKLFRISLVLLLVCAAAPAQQDTRSEVPSFPVAVWYSGGKARAPMLEEINADSARLWKADLLKIKGLGFNTVRTWVEWNVGEPREGEYHLENLDLLLRLADEAGLKVIIQVYVDSAPEWVGAKYPEGRYAAQDGQPIPSQAAPGFCFDNKNVRKAVLDFFQEVARHADKSAAFYGWDLWSEPAALNWARVGYKSEPMFCYCPASIERFREWLQKKYGTLEKLNAAWHRTFTDWKQVEPPRFGTILTYTDFMDWRVYYGYKLAEDLKMRNDAVRADRCLARHHQPRAKSFATGPHPGRSIRSHGRFPDERLGGFFWNQFLPEADGRGTQLDVEPAGSGDGFDLVNDRRARILRRRIAKRLWRAWNDNRVGSVRERSGDVDLGHGIARGPRDQLLRVLPDECGIRERRLRNDSAGWDVNGTKPAGRRNG